MANNKKAGNTSQGDSNLFAFLGILLPIIGFLIVKSSRPNDKYALYYSKQGIVLGIALVGIFILQTVALFLSAFTFGLTAILSFAITILYLPWVILWVIGMIYAFSGEEKEIPLVGNMAKRF